eukprot:GILJ01011000.1.p1 GENE.GILJ01011000.1~~GILJ01011000.1.p1  ORF type:complete len:572 (+),score=71.29 GILJ01011000.1:72-1787(+)
MGVCVNGWSLVAALLGSQLLLLAHWKGNQLAEPPNLDIRSVLHKLSGSTYESLNDSGGVTDLQAALLDPDIPLNSFLFSIYDDINCTNLTQRTMASKVLYAFDAGRMHAGGAATSHEGQWEFMGADQYRFDVHASSGFRLSIDGHVLLDAWSSSPPSSPSRTSHRRLLTHLTTGTHLLKIDHRCPGTKACSLRVHWSVDRLGLRVFVYPLPSYFNTDILRQHPACRQTMFASEIIIHERFMASDVLTSDPSEADLFFVPVYSLCKPLPKPLFGPDTFFGRRLLLQAIDFIRTQYPFWSRRAGADHVFVTAHDYSSCFHYKSTGLVSVPKSFQSRYPEYPIPAQPLQPLQNSILLSPLGDLMTPCFQPWKDIVIPPFVSSAPFEQQTMNRDPDHIDSTGGRSRFAYFRGSVNWFDGDPGYSKGLRQLLHRTFLNDSEVQIFSNSSGSYAEELRESVFCLCPPGFALWSPRPFESLAAGCIPVLIGNHLVLPFDDLIDWSKLSIKIAEEEVGGLKTSLKQVSEWEIAAKQSEIRTSWSAFFWDVEGSSSRMDAFKMLLRSLSTKAKQSQYLEL